MEEDFQPQALTLTLALTPHQVAGMEEDFQPQALTPTLALTLTRWPWVSSRRRGWRTLSRRCRARRRQRRMENALSAMQSKRAAAAPAP